MKELVEFIGDYPTWVKITVTFLGALIIVLLKLSKVLAELR